MRTPEKKYATGTDGNYIIDHITTPEKKYATGTDGNFGYP